MLFFGKKPTPPQLNEYTFTIPGGFKGFKRFPITIYGDPLSEKNNELLKNADLKGHSIIFRPGSSPTYRDPFYQVFADNLKIGAVFDKDQIKAISSGIIEKVYARSEEENVIENKKIVKRHRMKLFVKYRGE